METPLKQVRGLGSARSGTSHFWLQRVTGIANLFLVLFMIGFLLRHIGAPRADVVASFHSPIISILFMLSLASILWHMKLGLQVVIEDYVHDRAALIFALLANSFYVALLAAAAFYAILKMSFGA